MKIGETLEDARKRRGLSPSEAAEMLGIQLGHWYRIVRGETPNITLKVAARAKACLGVTLDDLADSEEIVALAGAQVAPRP